MSDTHRTPILLTAGNAGRYTRLCLQICLWTVIGQLPAYAFAEGAESPVADFAEPSQIVENLHHKLMDVMKSASVLGYQGRYSELEPVISANFDTPLIAKVVLSRYWDNLDLEQKRRFVELFKRLSIATYASRFDGYDGQEFQEIERERLRKGRLLIKTELRRPDDTPIRLDYLMHRTDDGWRIISVIANGVNDLSLKRAEYAAVIKEKGFQGLVDKIKIKIHDMETDSKS